MTERLYVATTDMGMTVLRAASLRGARRELNRRIGELFDPNLVKLATDDDVAWFTSMGGSIR